MRKLLVHWDVQGLLGATFEILESVQQLVFEFTR